MTNEVFMSGDRTLPKIDVVIQRAVAECSVEIVSVVLFGSRAAGDRNSLNDYEVLVLISNGTDLENYLRFNNYVRLELLRDRVNNVKILVFTPETFENILYKDRLVGTYLYIICRDNFVLLDKNNTFMSIQSRLRKNIIKPEENFMEQCIEFAKDLGSEKWGRKWEKVLLQHRYQKKRKSGII
jgi:predicted nucleotidyltransferase